jgi:uncharacterized protein
MIAYVDTSAVLKRLFDEPGADLVVQVWDSAAAVVSSEVVHPEARAALASARRSGRLDGEQLRATTCKLERLVADIKLIRMDGGMTDVAGGLTERHALPGFGAIHLAAVLSIDAPRVVVATWDRRLSAASRDCGMPVVPELSVQAAA